MLDLSTDTSRKVLSSRFPSFNPSSQTDTRRRWTIGEITEIVAALATLKTSEIANVLGVNPKALRSLLRRNGISLRALREHARKNTAKESGGVVVRRSAVGPSAVYGAAALADLADSACHWPLGDPAEPDFHFCGAKALRGKSYCPVHQGRAFERRVRHDA